MSAPRILVIMGSGETAPTMVPTHRMLTARLGSTVKAALLDTPYGFQENAPELAAKAVEYFKTSVNVTLEVAGLTQVVDGDALTVERGLNKVKDANYVFAGPGSPTYALRQWVGTSLPELLVSKLRSGGVVTFASAAALTLGRRTLPIYEIYKAGEPPRWLDGLDVLSAIGVDAAVIPHYNNAEGGHHDTRFCYMGERRLAMLERELPDSTYVLGVDEHTGVVIDLDTETASVVGKGVVTLRLRDGSTEIPSGETFPLDRLRDPRATATTSPRPQVAPAPVVEEAVDSNLRQATERLSGEFDAALEAGDADAAARSVLELEDVITSWSADTLQGTDGEFARATLRSMITRLAGAASSGLTDPRDVVGPYMDVLLTLRSQVRADKRFDLSDVIRDRLAAIGVEVRDTPSGAEWVLRD
ncbi:MAG: hypothetical protein RIS58_994 [Actinomycetota bacterium]|jgi:hypothetical protein